MLNLSWFNRRLTPPHWASISKYDPIKPTFTHIQLYQKLHFLTPIQAINDFFYSLAMHREKSWITADFSEVIFLFLLLYLALFPDKHQLFCNVIYKILQFNRNPSIFFINQCKIIFKMSLSSRFYEKLTFSYKYIYVKMSILS